MEGSSHTPVAHPSPVVTWLFIARGTTGPISALLLVVAATLPSLGVVIGFVFVLTAMLVGARRGAPAALGFHRPESWARTIGVGAAFGVVVQAAFTIVVDPLLERMTGTPVDVSSLDGMRGNVTAFLAMLGVGWVIGGVLEEMLFRGYLLRRLMGIFGSGPLAVGLAMSLPAVAFGMAHRYQDTAGMLSTGLIGLLLGALFVWGRYNLWLPIVAHGVLNTVGVTLIYLDLDRDLNRLLF